MKELVLAAIVAVSTVNADWATHESDHYYPHYDQPHHYREAFNPHHYGEQYYEAAYAHHQPDHYALGEGYYGHGYAADEYYGHGGYHTVGHPHERAGYVANQLRLGKRYEDPVMAKLADELLMYEDPAAYKQRKLEDEAAKEAAEIAEVQDPEARHRHYAAAASKEAKELQKITEPMTYHREQAEKEKAEYYAEQARQADPEYHALLAKVEEARKSAHMTTLW